MLPEFEEASLRSSPLNRVSEVVMEMTICVTGQWDSRDKNV